VSAEAFDKMIEKLTTSSHKCDVCGDPLVFDPTITKRSWCDRLWRLFLLRRMTLDSREPQHGDPAVEEAIAKMARRAP